MSELPIESMLRDVKIVEGFVALERWPGTSLVRDLCCHVRALATEVERLELFLSAQSNIRRYIAFTLTGDEAADSQLAADEAAKTIERLSAWRHDTETAMLAASANAISERKRAEKAEQTVACLPKTADGIHAVPGLPIYMYYLHKLWTAKIVNVGEDTVDVQYTNESTHAAKGCISRLKRVSEWYASREKAEAAMENNPC